MEPNTQEIKDLALWIHKNRKEIQMRHEYILSFINEALDNIKADIVMERDV